MIYLNSCIWLFFIWLDSHLLVTTWSDGALIHCVSVAVATLALTLKGQYCHEQKLLNIGSECAFSGFCRSLDELLALPGLKHRRLVFNRSKKNYCL